MNTELPTGWAQAELGDLLCSIVGGGTPSRDVEAYFHGTVPWFTVKDMKSPKPSDAQEHISHDAIANSSTNLIPPNTLICATRIAVGRAIKPTVQCAINQDLKALVTGPGVNSDFLLHWFSAYENDIQKKGVGTTVSGIRLETLRSLPVLLPPAPEQARIVARLEELLSQLESGLDELKTAQRKLETYRHSVVKMATDGTLPSELGLECGKQQQDGDHLFQHILAERRSLWELTQAAKFSALGKPLPLNWRSKYPSPRDDRPTDLPSLPHGWTWASIDQLSPNDLVNGRSVPTAAFGARVLRLSAVRNGRIDLTQSKFGDWSNEDASPFAVAENDLLIVRGNGSLSLVGRAGLVSQVAGQVAFPDTLIRLRLTTSVVRPAWVSLNWDSERSRNHLELRARTSAGIYKISQPDILSNMIPVPPLHVQDQILSVVDECKARIDVAGTALSMALKTSSLERKSILRAAFTGQLVPQDPNDEPAYQVLARVRADRSAKAGKGSRLGAGTDQR